MNNQGKKRLVIGVLLVVVGLAAFAVVMAANGWNFSAMNTAEFVTNTHEINRDFSKIAMNTETVDILFAASSDDTCNVVCYEQEDKKHDVSLQDDTLFIRVEDGQKWYERMDIHFDLPKITVYLPKGECAVLSINGSTGNIEIAEDFSFESVDISISTGDVKLFADVSGDVNIKTSTGSILAESLSAGAMNLTATTGRMTLSKVNCKGDLHIEVTTGRTEMMDVTCKNLMSDGSTGKINLTNVLTEGKLSIERSTGDVTFENVDAAEMNVETGTGDVKGSLRSEKIFLVETDTGKTDVPKTVSGGKCEIKTNTGNVQITISD